MVLPKMIFLGCLILLLAVVEATPPGIADHPAQASCKIKKYKMCYNLVHVCPKFCPDSCEVECASCKPICTSRSPPGGDTGSFPPAYVLPPSDSTDGDGNNSGGNGKDGGKEGGSDSPSDGSGSTPPYSPPRIHIDPSPPTPPTYSPPALPPSRPSPPPPTPTSSPPTPPTPSSPSPVTPTPSTPPSSPNPTPSTPSPPAPSILLPPPSDSTPSPAPVTPSPSTPESPPSSGVAARKRVRCTKKGYEACYGQEFTCPANCPTSCQVDCNSCKPVCSCDYPGAVCQDPRFIGGDGITFYFHGKKDRDFCLVTDPNLHINAHFIGKRNHNMTRDFTWVQSIGILFDNHRLYIGAQHTSIWNSANDRLSLSLDNAPIFLQETKDFQWLSTTLPPVTITRTSETNNIVIEVQGKFTITANVVPISEEESHTHNYNITKDDCFAHLDLGFKFHSLTQGVDGVLGKTYRDDYVSKVNMGVTMPVMGGEKEYSTSNLFATDCLISRFNGGEEGSPLVTSELASMKCGSGVNGEGVVCKR